MLSKLIPAIALAITLTACNDSNSSSSDGSGSGNQAQNTARGNAPVSEPSGCALAQYPSAQWTQCELNNLAVSSNGLPLYTALLPAALAASANYQLARTALLLSDPERQPNPSLCTPACAIDPRLQNWSGLVEPVLYTSRSGATISGHVWATQEGPAKRPGIIIINGSILAFDEAYWYLAQTLAKAGFVVMTFDAQGEGMSDQFGASPDANEAAFAGTPALGLLGPIPASGPGLGGNGLPFYDGAADALDFFVSTPAQQFVPVPSRTSATSHAAKQQRRVEAGLNAAYNPLWELLDANNIGLAGHSYGAVAASWLGQQEPRVKAVVALDNLCVPVSPAPDELVAFTTAPVNKTIAGVFYLYGFSPECFGAPDEPAPAISTPALGITADYIAPTPYLQAPDPLDKQQASRTYSGAGVDSGSIVIRGGSHLEFSDTPYPGLPISLRGPDITTWYTVAWFAKYLQHNPNADRMLLSARWRDDVASTDADTNQFSWHYQSRLDIGLKSGIRFNCENLREGCVGQYRPSEDCGGVAEYGFVSIATGQSAGPPTACQD